MAPKLNDVFCFFTWMGDWKNITVPIVLKHKRDMDRIIHIYGRLFSPEIYVLYNVLIHRCFATFTGYGKDAALKVESQKLKANWGDAWNADWDAKVLHQADVKHTKLISKEYNDLMVALAQEIGAGTPTLASRRSSA